MNKKQIESAIKETVRTLVEHRVPNEETLRAIESEGYTMQRVQVPPFDGIVVKPPCGEGYYLAERCRTTVKSATVKRGVVKNRLYRFSANDITAYKKADEMLAVGDWSAAALEANHIESATLKNIVEEGINAVIREKGEPSVQEPSTTGGLPYEDPFAEAETALDLRGEQVCITGALPGMTREQAFDRLKELGGIPNRTFKKSTTLFVTASEHRSKKRLAAERAIAEGRELRIVDGHEFVEALKAAETIAAERPKPKAETTAEPKPAAKSTPKKEPKPEVEVAATVTAKVTVESMKSWCTSHGVLFNQAGKNPENPIWVVGVKKGDAELHDELKEMGFCWGTSKKFGKGWWRKPEAA